MMTEKPKIQYIGQFYVPGSEAQVLAPKKKKKSSKKNQAAPPESGDAGAGEPAAD